MLTTCLIIKQFEILITLNMISPKIDFLQLFDVAR